MSVAAAVPSRLNASDGRRMAPTKSAFEAGSRRHSVVKSEVRRYHGITQLGLGAYGFGEKEIVRTAFVPGTGV